MYFHPFVRFFWEGLCRSEWHEPKRRIYDCEFIYLSKGQYHLDIAEKVHEIHAGDLVIIPPATIHESHVPKGGEAMRHCIHFDWTLDRADDSLSICCFVEDDFDKGMVHQVMPELSGRLPLHSKRERHVEILPMIEESLRLFREASELAPLSLWPVLAFLLRESAPLSKSFSGKSHRAVMQLKHYIDDHFTEDIGYEDFMSVTGLSQNHLVSIFRKSMLKTPLAYLTDLRLHRAQSMLKTSHLNVSQVAREVGIGDANYFARVFKHEFGVSPSQIMSS